MKQSALNTEITINNIFTVWAVEDNGVFCTGVLFLFRLSHKTICPEYVPPTMRFGWNFAKQTDITADYRKENSIHLKKLEIVKSLICNSTYFHISGYNIKYHLVCNIPHIATTISRLIDLDIMLSWSFHQEIQESSPYLWQFAVFGHDMPIEIPKCWILPWKELP